MSKKNSSNHEFILNQLTIPTYVSHLKPGTTLSANDDIFIVQDGSTTIEIRAPPKFEPKKAPWHDGLIRDIVWCSEFRVFILLTQKGLFTFNPQSLVTFPTTTINTDTQLNISSYSKIKPYDENHSFWRCACVGKTIYISYSGKN